MRPRNLKLTSTLVSQAIRDSELNQHQSDLFSSTPRFSSTCPSRLVNESEAKETNAARQAQSKPVRDNYNGLAVMTSGWRN